MTDLKQVVAVKEIETRRELYDSYLDPDWTERLAHSVPPQLSTAFSSLCLAWKESMNTQRIPTVMVEQMASFAKGYMRVKPMRGRRMIDAVQIDIQGRRVRHVVGHQRCREQRNDFGRNIHEHAAIYSQLPGVSCANGALKN